MRTGTNPGTEQRHFDRNGAKRSDANRRPDNGQRHLVPDVECVALLERG